MKKRPGCSIKKAMILLVNLEFISGSLANELGKQRRDEVVELEEEEVIRRQLFVRDLFA